MIDLSDVATPAKIAKSVGFSQDLDISKYKLSLMLFETTLFSLPSLLVR
jgi:hypothetical protein